MKWPAGKKFAFTIFDDTDGATTENVRAVYQLLKDQNIFITKSIWPIKGENEPMVGGDTCENKDYLSWILKLKGEGFEIGYHNATYHTSDRRQTIHGLNRFKELFDSDPQTMANHANCGESIYWGPYRLTNFNRYLYLMLTKFRFQNTFRGHIEHDELFWGDVCRDRIKYVRNFVFSDINTLNVCPQMPYHDPDRPFVNYWFASTEGPNVESFITHCSIKNIDKLEEEGGACIMYTHLANGFCERGQVHQGFRQMIERLSRKKGWFVPVGQLLDYIIETRGPYIITAKERNRLELKWLVHKIRVGES